MLPTPTHAWNVPVAAEIGATLLIKRDDLTGMQLSGNKVRKLEFLLADAMEKKADMVVTLGGIQSNHCRATAVAARYLGMDSTLVLRTSRADVEKDPGLEGNLLVERLVGADVKLVTRQEYTERGSEAIGLECAERLAAAGRRPYYIPVGGSNALGTWGYVLAAAELAEQLPHVDDIVVACGSGGTAAGIALGNAVCGLNARVTAYCVCDDEEYFYDYCQDLIDGVAGAPGEFDARKLMRLRQAKGKGYAVSTEEELTACKDIAAVTGIVLDPVYAGKAAAAMLSDMKNDPSDWSGRTVVFIHTGGLLGTFEKQQQILPLVSPVERFYRQQGDE